MNEASEVLPVVALRRFRHPLPIRVHVKDGQPTSVSIMKRGLSGGSRRGVRRPLAHIGRVVGDRDRDSGLGAREPELEHPKHCTQNREPRAQSRELRAESQRRPWDRDEWDVALADGPTYRLFRERHTDRWFLEGVVD